MAMLHAGRLCGGLPFITCLSEPAIHPSFGESEPLCNSHGLAFISLIFLPNSCKKGDSGAGR